MALSDPSCLIAFGNMVLQSEYDIDLRSINIPENKNYRALHHRTSQKLVKYIKTKSNNIWALYLLGFKTYLQKTEGWGRGGWSWGHIGPHPKQG